MSVDWHYLTTKLIHEVTSFTNEPNVSTAIGMKSNDGECYDFFSAYASLAFNLENICLSLKLLITSVRFACREVKVQPIMQHEIRVTVVWY